MATCACGARMSKYAGTCRGCHQASMRRAAEEYRRVAARGTCPHHPDTALVANISLAGTLWLQCARTALAGYRPSCGFQVLCETDAYAALTSGATVPRPRRERPGAPASRAEQHGRYLDCGPAAWDDR